MLMVGLTSSRWERLLFRIGLSTKKQSSLVFGSLLSRAIDLLPKESTAQRQTDDRI